MMHRSRPPVSVVLALGGLLVGCPASENGTASAGSSSGASTTDTTGAATATTDGATSVAPTSTGDVSGNGSSSGGGSSEGTTGSPLVDRRVFVTSVAYHGDLKTLGGAGSGIEGADSLCNSLAQAAGLGGTWVAWVSTSTVDAISRLAADGRWTLIDGATEVFPSRGDVQFGPLHAIDTAEDGEVVSDLGDVVVWTNTDRFGKNVTAGQANACDDWSGQVGTADVGVVVDPQAAMGLSWTDTGQPRACGSEFRLYCFES